MNIMKRRFVRLWLLILLLAPQWAWAEAMSTAVIERMEAVVVKSIATKDTKSVANLFSDDIQILLEVNGQNISMNKQQYLTYLRKGWTVIENYQYTTRNRVVTVETPERAVVTCDVMETVVFNGQVYKANTEEESIVEMRHGKPLVTKITGHMSLTSSVDL